MACCTNEYWATGHWAVVFGWEAVVLAMHHTLHTVSFYEVKGLLKGK